MSKKIGIIVAVVLILGLLGFVAFSQMKKPVSNIAQTPLSDENKIETSQVTRASIKSLMAAGKSVNCKISDPNSKTKGETYVTGNKVRSDFTISDQSGNEMKSHMISDGTYAYMWTDNSKTGTKIKMDAVLPSGSPASSVQTQTTNLDQEVDLNCTEWSVDNAKFEIPKDIQFSDLSNLTKPGGNTSPKIDSSVCNQIEDPQAKASCIKSLNEN